LRATRIDCLLLTDFDSEFAFLKNVCGRLGIRMHHANTLEQADFLLMATEATVLVSDVTLADCSWRCALHLIGGRYPLTAMLVLADPVDRPFLQQASSLGVCGIIWKPVQVGAAARLIRTAHQAWEDRQCLRQMTDMAACPGR